MGKDTREAERGAAPCGDTDRGTPARSIPGLSDHQAVAVIGMIGLTLILLLLSHFESGTHHIMIVPELDDLEVEGASFLASQQSSNTVPMIGKKAASPASQPSSSSLLPSFFQPYLLKFLDLGLRGRETYPEIGKRGRVHLDASLPHWLRQDLARLGKRGAPSFSIPEHWTKKTFVKPSLSKLRNGIFGDRDKRTARENMNLQWFRFYGDNNHKRREAFYKRSDEGHTQDFNSVPFMGKRSEERGDAGVRSGEGIMVRRPRYRDYNDYNEEEASKKEEVDVNPWSFIDMESQKGTRRLL